MNILCISRSSQYSPNMADNDSAIFASVCSELTNMGNSVATISETDMVGYDYTPYQRILTMARDTFSLVMLEKETSTEVQSRFINSIDGILRATNKAAVASQFLEAGIPQPEFIAGKGKEILICSAESPSAITVPLWLKNCDGSATIAEDTTFCSTNQDFQNAFDSFASRNIQMWIAQTHLPGDLVKFYGVEGTDFFDWDYASKGHSKFGHEAINGKEHGFSFSAQRLKYYADKAAKVLNTPIYGGDAIIDSEGNFYIIDFNDFPSFSRCRNQAAKAIAQKVVQTNP